MVDLNSMVNEGIKKERLHARFKLASEILGILGCPESDSEYTDRVQKVRERLFEVKDEYFDCDVILPVFWELGNDNKDKNQ